MSLTTPRVDRRPAGKGWTAPHLADQSDRGYRRSATITLVILTVVAAGDLVLIKSTFDRVMGQYEIFSWILAIGLTVAAISAMYSAGAETKTATAAGRTRTSSLKSTSLVVAWVLLGVGLLWLRWNSQLFMGQTTYEGDSGAGTGQDLEHYLAIVLLMIYIATGVLAWVDGYKLTNGAAAAMRETRRQYRSTAADLAVKEGRVARLIENLAIHRYELAAIDRERDLALRARDDLAAELKEHARVQLAMQLADPAATGVVRNRPTP